MIPFFKLIFQKRHYSVMMNLFGIFAGILAFSVLIANLINVRQIMQLLFALIFVPVALHFAIEIKNFLHRLKSSHAHVKPKVKEIEKIAAAEIVSSFVQPEVIEVQEVDQVKEKQRRAFIKLIAGAGAGVFLTSLLNPAKASAAFFGSVPGPGVLSVKDSNGTKIDPSIKSPTDGFGISNVDSASYPAFYGFVNKDGGWYILQENPQNTFLYVAGASSYPTNWTGRAGLTYGTYDTTF